MSHANNCDAVRQGLPSMWCVRLLALILSDHTDRGSAVQSLDAVVPDWSMMCIPSLPALNPYHHGSEHDHGILAADCPWTFHLFKKYLWFFKVAFWSYSLYIPNQVFYISRLLRPIRCQQPLYWLLASSVQFLGFQAGISSDDYLFSSTDMSQKIPFGKYTDHKQQNTSRSHILIIDK